ncbi:MAG: putative metal-binding motif-containing protein [Myxococcota bacterium]
MTYTLRPQHQRIQRIPNPHWLALSVGLVSTGCLLSPLPSVPAGMAYCEPDRDGDGYAPELEQCYALSEGVIVDPPSQPDCNNLDAAINPNAPEYSDGRDNDCDGIVDDNTEVYDDDGDGFSESSGDCDDTNGTIYPDAPESDPAVDSNCDGETIGYLPATPVPDPDSDATKALALFYQDAPPPGFLGYTQVVGDLDGDGFEELAMSSGNPDSGSTVYVFYGQDGGPSGNQLFSNAQLKIRGIGQPDSNGIRITGGDLNCDGSTDLLIGDWFQRRVSIFYGGVRRTGDLDANSADVIFRPVEDGAYPIGAALAVPGDIDGDGCDDLLLGQPDYMTGAGRILLFYGRTQFDKLTHVEQADASFTGEYELDFAGTQVHGLSDLNGDGYADFAINVPWFWTYDSDYILTGKLSLFYGQAERFSGEVSVASAPASFYPDLEVMPYINAFDIDTGDIDNDGHRDIVVGMPAYSYEGYGAFGVAAVLYGTDEPYVGSLYLTSLPLTWLSPMEYGDLNAASVTVSDMTGDGIDDAAVVSSVNVADVEYGGYAEPGYVAVYAGGPGRPRERKASEREGALISGGYGSLEGIYPIDSRDLTGDGIAELIVGAQYFIYDDPRSAVYVFKGGALP